MLTAVSRNNENVLYKNRSHDLSVRGANVIGNSSLLSVNSKKRGVTMICGFFCDSVNATSSAGCRWIALVVAG